MKVKLVLICDHYSYFDTLFNIAQSLNETDKFEIKFIFPLNYDQTNRQKKQLQKKKIKYDQYYLKNILALKILARYSKFIYFFANYFYQYLNFIKMLKKEKPKLIVLASENRFYQNLYCKISYRRGIESFITPPWLANEKEIIESTQHHDDQNINTIFRKITITIFPNWKSSIRGINKLPIAIQEIWVKEIFRIRPEKPWILHSGFSSKIILESDFQYRLALQYGLPKEKLNILGSPILDRLMSGYQEVQDGYTLFAIPPNMDYHRKTVLNKYDSWMSEVSFIAETLNMISTMNKIIFHCHPSIKDQELKIISDLQKKYKTKTEISTIPIYELIPESRCFVASISSTIQWALYSAKPVINYDFYKYEYDDYKGISSILYAQTREEFREKIAALINHFDEIESMAQQEAINAVGSKAKKGFASNFMNRMDMEN